MRYGRIPDGPLTALVDVRASTYTLYEETGSGTDWNGSNALTDTGNSARLDVHNHRSSPQSYPTGETFETQLQGLCTVAQKNDDVTNGNCIVHGGSVYEMTVDPWPDAQNPRVYVLELEERTDLQPP